MNEKLPSTETKIPGYLKAKRAGEFLFIEGDLVVLRVMADCVNCAWREGHPKVPLARVASYVDDFPFGDNFCIRQRNRENKIKQSRN